MKARQAVKCAAVMLQLDDARKFIQDSSYERGSYEAGMLLDCVNMAVNETVCEFLPQKIIECIKSKNKRIQYSDFMLDLNDIYSVRLNGVKQRFKRLSDGILLEADGEYEVCYSFIPKDCDMDEEMCCNDAMLIALGAARDYCIIYGRLDEAQLYEQRYKQRIENKLAEKQSRQLP